MAIETFLYKVSIGRRWENVPGFWRFKRWAKKLVDGNYYRVPYLEGHVWVCPTHAMGRQIFLGQVYEPSVINIIRYFVRSGFSYIDVGANIGLHTLAAAFSRISPEQEFWAFEPEPTCYSILQRNCQSNGLSFVKCTQEALGDRQGEATLNISTTPNKGNHSILSHPGTKAGPIVKITTLDNILGQAHWNRRTVLKIDVEGYEWPVINGGINWLAEQGELVLMCEINKDALQRFGKTLTDLIGSLKNAGFDSGLIIRDESEMENTGNNTNEILMNTLFLKNASVETGSHISPRIFQPLFA